MKFSAPRPIDPTNYLPGMNKFTPMYGLPEHVEFCSRCVYSNQKPNSAREYKHKSGSTKEVVHFDGEKVCAACRNVERKSSIDWAEREKELVELCNRYRRSDGRYDCVVPGSGGKDSIYASHILKHKYGMNPLTVTFTPHIYTDWGRRNFDAWLDAGFDNLAFTPNKRVERLLTRIALETIFHPFQPFMMGQMYLPPKLAKLHGIELVFYGENPSDYGNRVKKERPDKDLSFFSYNGDLKELAIAGLSREELKEDFGLTETDLLPYTPPATDELQRSNVNVQYLGYYLKWHPQSCYYYATEHTGFEPSPERTTGTYSKYSSIDDKIDDFHYFTTFIKFGIGRATYDSAQEVRSGDITREEAVALIRRYDGEYPERFMPEVLRYLSIPDGEFPVAYKQFEQPIMDRAYFDRLTDEFRSPHLWALENGSWKLRKTVFDT